MVHLVLATLIASNLPPGGRYKDCFGTIDHVSLQNVRVHCTNGTPVDESFLSWPKFVSLPDDTTVESKYLHPGTRVHVVFSQSLGLRHAYKVYIYCRGAARGCAGLKT